MCSFLVFILSLFFLVTINNIVMTEQKGCNPILGLLEKVMAELSFEKQKKWVELWTGDETPHSHHVLICDNGMDI